MQLTAANACVMAHRYGKRIEHVAGRGVLVLEPLAEGGKQLVEHVLEPMQLAREAALVQ